MVIYNINNRVLNIDLNKRYLVIPEEKLKFQNNKHIIELFVYKNTFLNRRF